MNAPHKPKHCRHCLDCPAILPPDHSGDLCERCQAEVDKWETDDSRYNDPRRGQAADINAMIRRPHGE